MMFRSLLFLLFLHIGTLKVPDVHGYNIKTESRKDVNGNAIPDTAKKKTHISHQQLFKDFQYSQNEGGNEDVKAAQKFQISNVHSKRDYQKSSTHRQIRSPESVDKVINNILDNKADTSNGALPSNAAKNSAINVAVQPQGLSSATTIPVQSVNKNIKMHDREKAQEKSLVRQSTTTQSQNQVKPVDKVNVIQSKKPTQMLRGGETPGGALSPTAIAGVNKTGNTSNVQLQQSMQNVSGGADQYDGDNSERSGYFDSHFYAELMKRYKSKDGFWAVLALGFLFCVLFVAVWYSKMWRYRDPPLEVSPEDQDFESVSNFSKKSSIKDLLQNKLRYLPEKFKAKFQRIKKNAQNTKYKKLKKHDLLSPEDDSEEELIYKRM